MGNFLAWAFFISAVMMIYAVCSAIIGVFGLLVGTIIILMIFD